MTVRYLFGSRLKKIIDPFSFVADSEREKQEWVEAINESIAETLYDYEVAEKIWFNQANRSCADCGASQPEWASVNLGVVICKKCAGKGHTYKKCFKIVSFIFITATVIKMVSFSLRLLERML